MAGGDGADNPNLKGLSKIFNSETNTGRANEFEEFLEKRNLIDYATNCHDNIFFTGCESNVCGHRPRDIIFYIEAIKEVGIDDKQQLIQAIMLLHLGIKFTIGKKSHVSNIRC